MAKDVLIKNNYMMYLENNPYHYPSCSDKINPIVDVQKKKFATIVTGWHILPNFLWRHVCRPCQWAEVQIQSEEFCPIGVDMTIYNPIPITSNLSLQRTNTFSAFNNCVYSLLYEDDCYETDWFPWNFVNRDVDINLYQREGIVWSGPDANASHNDQHPSYTSKKYIPPLYHWRRPNIRTQEPHVWGQGLQSSGVYNVTSSNGTETWVPNGIFWDPFVRGDKIGELRAGKNAYSFSFTHPDPKWHNTDQLASYATWTVPGPYIGCGRPWTYQRTSAMDPDRAMTFGKAYEDTGSNNQSGHPLYDDYTIPNMGYLPIWCPNWFWKEIENNIIDANIGTFTNDEYKTKIWKKPDKYWGGTEYNAYKTTIPQWFAKGVPLYDEEDKRIKTLTQVSVSVTLRLKIKKRRTAYNSATWGPISGEQLYYCNPNKIIMQPNVIRYRTHGTRMSWQNINTVNNNQVAKAHTHPREDNYVATGTESSRQYGTNERPAGILDANEDNNMDHTHQNKSITVRYTPGSERVVIETGRKRTHQRPEPMDTIAAFATQM